MRKTTVNLNGKTEKILKTFGAQNASGAVNRIIGNYFELLQPIIDDLRDFYTEPERQALIAYMDWRSMNPLSTNENRMQELNEQYTVDIEKMNKTIAAMPRLQYFALIEMLAQTRSEKEQ